MSKIRRWLDMTWRERNLLARAVASLAAARFLSGLREPRPTRRAAHRAGAEAIARAVITASRHVPFSTTCLHRALALFRLLGAEGLDAALRIGVRTAGGILEAHAWVEHDGQVLLDEEASRYVAFDVPILTTK